MLLSLKVPVAMNCCVEPTDSVGVAGVTVIDTNPVGVRVPGRYNSALATAATAAHCPPPQQAHFHHSVTSRCENSGRWSYYPWQ